MSCPINLHLREAELQSRVRAISLGQLALEIERLRRNHELTCPACQLDRPEQEDS